MVEAFDQLTAEGYLDARVAPGHVLQRRSRMRAEASAEQLLEARWSICRSEPWMATRKN